MLTVNYKMYEHKTISTINAHYFNKAVKSI